MISFNKRVARILQDAGVVDGDAAQELLEKADGSEAPLTTLLVDDGVIDERRLLGTLAEHTKVAPIDLRHLTPDEHVLEAIPSELAFYYGVFPVSRIGDVLTLAVTNPYDVVKLDDVRIVTGCDLRLVLTLDQHMQVALDKGYRTGQREVEEILGSMDEGDVALKEQHGAEAAQSIDFDTLGDGDDSPVIKFINMMIYQAAKERTSDIHIEPFEKRMIVRFRNDGVLREVFSPPRRMLNALVSRIKIMASLDIAERRKPQDGKFQMRIDGRQVDFRVSILPCIHGEKVVLRLLDAGNLKLSLDSLGFEESSLENFREAISQPYGMILVTGPTGSGKSTTLYSAVKEMLDETENFITVEDPVEYQLEGINQVQVNVKRGLTFAAALRSILRQDPDKILLGEIRDKETIEIAIKAALTGHLVLSTLHTNDAPSTITRMIDMDVDPFMVASATLLVSAQRLCRKLCGSCKEQVASPPKERLLALGLREEDLGEGGIEGLELYGPRGCPRCTNGYAGRFAILETMPMSEPIKRVIIEGGSSTDIRDQALEEGMISLRRCGLRAALRGRTSIEEVLRVTLTA